MPDLRSGFLQIRFSLLHLSRLSAQLGELWFFVFSETGASRTVTTAQEATLEQTVTVETVTVELVRAANFVTVMPFAAMVFFVVLAVMVPLVVLAMMTVIAAAMGFNDMAMTRLGMMAVRIDTGVGRTDRSKCHGSNSCSGEKRLFHT